MIHDHYSPPRSTISCYHDRHPWLQATVHIMVIVQHHDTMPIHHLGHITEHNPRISDPGSANDNNYNNNNNVLLFTPFKSQLKDTSKNVSCMYKPGKASLNWWYLLHSKGQGQLYWRPLHSWWRAWRMTWRVDVHGMEVTGKVGRHQAMTDLYTKSKTLKMKTQRLYYLKLSIQICPIW